MATTPEQGLIDQFGPGMAEYINSQRGANGKNNVMKGTTVDPQDVGSVIAGFKASPQSVYSTSNITNAVTNPTPAPDDLLGIRTQIGNELGISGLESGYQTAFGELQKEKGLARAQQTAIEGLPQALGVIRGEQAQAGKLASDRISSLSEAAQVSQSALQAAKQEQESRFSIRQSEVEQKRALILNNPGAGITFGDTVESAASKIKKYEDNKIKEAQKIKEKELKDADKSDLKKMALQLGLKTSGSRKDLEKRISKAVKEDKDFEKALKIKSASGSGSKSDTVKDFTDTEQRLLANDLFNEAVSKGNYGNYTYKYMQQQGAELGLDTAEGSVFDNAIRSKFGMGSKKAKK